jgi:Mrp family chromosome partitioning ATPase
LIAAEFVVKRKVQMQGSLMKIAVASGRGGTGKTTIATNLAWIAAWVLQAGFITTAP